jgi:hypothetical protein
LGEAGSLRREVMEMLYSITQVYTVEADTYDDARLALSQAVRETETTGIKLEFESILLAPESLSTDAKRIELKDAIRDVLWKSDEPF